MWFMCPCFFFGQLFMVWIISLSPSVLFCFSFFFPFACVSFFFSGRSFCSIVWYCVHPAHVRVVCCKVHEFFCFCTANSSCVYFYRLLRAARCICLCIVFCSPIWMPALLGFRSHISRDVALKFSIAILNILWTVAWGIADGISEPFCLWSWQL